MLVMFELFRILSNEKAELPQPQKILFPASFYFFAGDERLHSIWCKED